MHPAGAVQQSWEQKDGLDKIYAVILQYKAAEMRAVHVRAGEYYPRGRNSYDGCIHSIMLRTGAARNVVKDFVHEWCRLNEEVLMELALKIAAEPFRNYFC